MILDDQFTIEILPGRTQIKNKIEQSLNNFIKLEKNQSLKNLVKDALFPGRRLRPIMLYLLTSHKQNIATYNELNNLALAVELCHRSSIILDDLIDEDDIRRKTPAYHKNYGKNNTILISHYLVAKVYDQFLFLPKNIQNTFYNVFTEAYKKMTLGELGDIGSIVPKTNYIYFYENTIIHKTSALFELIFSIAARLRSFDEKQTKYMKEVGQKVGQLYQIYNDIYDDLISSNEERGYKKTWRINLTLLKCFLLDYGTNKEKKLVLAYVGKNCPENLYEQIRESLNSEKCTNFITNYNKKLYSQLMNILTKIKAKDIKETVIYFYKWLKQKKCWDQKELTNAGY